MEKLILKDVAYGSHERQKADIFIPQKSESCGLILFIHGGGWTEGDKSAHESDALYFCNLGYLSASINYRFVSDDISVFEELEDIALALTVIKEKAAEYGIFAEKLILSGGSAGAHLSLLYAYTRREVSPIVPVAVCAYCPPVSCEKTDFLFGISEEFDDWKYGLLSKCCKCQIEKSNFLSEEQQTSLRKISPSEYVSCDCVPTAVFHGRYDDLVPIGHTYEFLKLLSENKVTNDLLVYENSGHTLDKDPETDLKAKEIIQAYAEKYF